jgi:hypothetical protein
MKQLNCGEVQRAARMKPRSEATGERSEKYRTQITDVIGDKWKNRNAAQDHGQ